MKYIQGEFQFESSELGSLLAAGHWWSLVVRLCLVQCPQDDGEAEEDGGGETGAQTGARVDQHVSHIVPGPIIGLGWHAEQLGEQLIHVNQLDGRVDLSLTLSVEI